MKKQFYNLEELCNDGFILGTMFVRREENQELVVSLLKDLEGNLGFTQPIIVVSAEKLLDRGIPFMVGNRVIREIKDLKEKEVSALASEKLLCVIDGHQRFDALQRKRILEKKRTLKAIGPMVGDKVLFQISDSSSDVIGTWDSTNLHKEIPTPCDVLSLILQTHEGDKDYDFDKALYYFLRMMEGNWSYRGALKFVSCGKTNRIYARSRNRGLRQILIRGKGEIPETFKNADRFLKSLHLMCLVYEKAGKTGDRGYVRYRKLICNNESSFFVNLLKGIEKVRTRGVSAEKAIYHFVDTKVTPEFLENYLEIQSRTGETEIPATTRRRLFLEEAFRDYCKENSNLRGHDEDIDQTVYLLNVELSERKAEKLFDDHYKELVAKENEYKQKYSEPHQIKDSLRSWCYAELTPIRKAIYAYHKFKS